MSFTDSNKNHEEAFDKEPSDTEENYQTDEEEGISDESFSDSITKLKNISIEKDHKNSSTKKRMTKNHFGRLSESRRYRKSNRHFRAKNESQKIIKRKNTNKKFAEKNKSCLEKSIETSKKGKRCRLGGKAKGKPPEEDSHDKHDSDDESENNYFGRISLGYFQQFRDRSGASTSYQWEESFRNPFSLCLGEETHDKSSEDMELLELQRWGMSTLVSFEKKNEKLNGAEDIHPESL